MQDVFMKEYSPLSDEEKQTCLDIKTKAEELLALFYPENSANREANTAKTHLETAVMWAVKSICRKGL